MNIRIQLLLILFSLFCIQFENAESPMHYEVVHGWPVLPENQILNEVSAVAVDSKQNVFILMRGGRTWPDSDILDTSLIPAATIFIFDRNSGQLLGKWGENTFALPHG